MAPVWDLTSVKALLRTTSQRLGQLQDRNDAKGNATRREIAALLRQGSSSQARMKAQEVIQEDTFGDILEMLEMHVGIILEHVSEIGQSGGSNPAVIEAASSIIHSAPHVDCKELHEVRDLLVRQMGMEFSKDATENTSNRVSARITKALSPSPTTASEVNGFLAKIAKTNNIDWSPGPQRNDLQTPILQILQSNETPVVDLGALRALCVRGIPDEPSWLRPRIWKLYFGVLPVLKATWHRSMSQQRSSYYELVRRLLEPFADLPTPTNPLHPLDISLTQAANQLYSIPSNMLQGLKTRSELPPLCPLDDLAPAEVKLTCAKNLDLRLEAIKDESGVARSDTIPEIRLDDESQSDLPYTTSSEDLNEAHSSALLRILYLHSSINPASRSPNVPALLAPLYSVLNQEVEGDDLAHVEADTFWLFEALISEFSELEDEDGGRVWMKKFGERLTWADSELMNSLAARGLDPAQPHYSYGWMAPLLANTLPFSSLVVTWDAVFSCPPRQKDDNARLNMLLDVCTAMLVRAKVALLRLGKNQQKFQTLWGQEVDALPPPSPIHPWELGSAFSEGIAFLQNYRIDAAGGIDRILQSAVDFKSRREEEDRVKALQQTALPLTARLRVNVWKGFTNQLGSPDRSPVASDDEDEVQAKPESTGPGLTSMLAITVWRGITNQSSMETPPTPTTPFTPQHPRTPLSPPSPASASSPPPSPAPSNTSNASSIWEYASKLQDSDAVATFSKVSSNWRARALSTWRRQNEGSTSHEQRDVPPITQPHSQPVSPMLGFKQGEVRRGSLPAVDRHNTYSPPARPQFFRPPRDTVLFPGGLSGLRAQDGDTEHSDQSDSGLLQKTKGLQASLAALTRSADETPVKPKAGPKPLLLSSSSLMTNTSARERPISRSETSTPVLPNVQPGQWNHVMSRRQPSHRDSQSSISSLSPSDALNRVRAGWESDGQSRKVRLNRQSVSPMAPHSRTSSAARSSGNSPDRGPVSPSSQTGWGQVDLPDSPMTPRTPITSPNNNTVTINDPDTSTSPPIPPSVMDTTQERKLPPMSIPSPVEKAPDSPVPETPSRSPRVRSKRHHTRPARLQDPGRRSPALSLSVDVSREQETVTTPKATQFDEVMSSPSPTSSRSPIWSRKNSGDDASQLSRKLSTEGNEPRPRKISTGSRTRKTSATRKHRESAAEEGDDEGYDDLLSAYESEEGSQSMLR